jgi:hypothetical protein
MLENWVDLCVEKFRLKYEQMKFSELLNVELNAANSLLSGTPGDRIRRFREKIPVTEFNFPEIFSFFKLFNIYIFTFRVKVTHFCFSSSTGGFLGDKAKWWMEATGYTKMCITDSRNLYSTHTSLLL